MRERIRLTGTCPERALSRLTRQKIAVYDALKTDAKTIEFAVEKRDIKKVFEIYPRAGSGAYGVYFVERLPARGTLKAVEFFRCNVGVLVGAICFALLLFSGDKLVLKVVVDAPKVYHAQVYDALEEHGVKTYAVYKAGKEDLICARLLALDGVSYCSVKKSGATLTVTLKTNAFFEGVETGELYAQRAGKITKIFALSGTPIVQVGKEVSVGERLVEGRVYNSQGEWRQVPVVAYAQIACAYERAYACETEGEAFAKAYLEAGLEDSRAQLRASKVEKGKEGYVVLLQYEWTQRIRI